MVRATRNLQSPQRGERLLAIWNLILSTEMIVAAKRTSWGSFVATSNDPTIAESILQCLNVCGWASLAVGICDIQESFDDSMRTLEVELLDHNSYWQGIKLLTPDNRKAQSHLRFAAQQE